MALAFNISDILGLSLFLMILCVAITKVFVLLVCPKMQKLCKDGQSVEL